MVTLQFPLLAGGNVLEYLCDQEQKVTISEIVSFLRVGTYGVPQETVVGPLDSTILVNELLQSQTQGEILRLAGDISILYAGSTWDQLKWSTERD